MFNSRNRNNRKRTQRRGGTEPPLISSNNSVAPITAASVNLKESAHIASVSGTWGKKANTFTPKGTIAIPFTRRL
jgi:hypothetical protein